MTVTFKLINISIISHSYHFSISGKKIYIRYTLSKFQVYSTINYSHNAIYWMSWTFISVQLLSRVQLCVTHGSQHARPLCSSSTPGVYSNSCPLGRWYHRTISSSVVPFSCLQTFSASGSFQMSQFFASVGQSIGISASTSVLPMNIQDWFPLGLTGWISLQSKGLSRVFSNTTV